MTDSESPRTIFELLYTHCPEAPTRFQFDNGCNIQRCALHREPCFLNFTHFQVDLLHFVGHKNCLLAYSTGRARRQHTLLQCVLHVTVAPAYLYGLEECTRVVLWSNFCKQFRSLQKSLCISCGSIK